MSMLVYRGFAEVTLFCVPCEITWTVPLSKPGLRSFLDENGFGGKLKYDS